MLNGRLGASGPYPRRWRTSRRLAHRHGVWRSLVAHSLWERGAVGSNPATPTARTDPWDVPHLPCGIGRRGLLDSNVGVIISRGSTPVKSTVETLSSTRVRLDIEVPFAELEPSVKKAYRDISAQVTIPGFRRGKVPAAVIDQRVGREAILSE